MHFYGKKRESEKREREREKTFYARYASYGVSNSPLHWEHVVETTVRYDRHSQLLLDSGEMRVQVIWINLDTSVSLSLCLYAERLWVTWRIRAANEPYTGKSGTGDDSQRLFPQIHLLSRWRREWVLLSQMDAAGDRERQTDTPKVTGARERRKTIIKVLSHKTSGVCERNWSILSLVSMQMSILSSFSRWWKR